MRSIRFQLMALLALLALTLPTWAQNQAEFEKRVTVHKLANGLTVLFIERHNAPVFSFATFVDAGSAQDPLGKTGLAHMMEHMAFKGTDEIGTTNIAAEKLALAKVEKAYAAYDAERNSPTGANEAKVAELEKVWKAAIDEADQYVVKNEFGEIVEREGGVGMNAYTNTDETVYFYSMPANRVELWAYLESSRFLNPVLREFYKERDVVYEERRMRTDSSPVGKLEEEFLGVSFDASPYHRPTIGYSTDLKHFSATDAAQFFHDYYSPANITIAVAGDINPATLLPLIDKYFGRIPAAEKPQEYVARDQAQNSERKVSLQLAAQPFYFEGYHRPSYKDADDDVYSAISDILSNGRVSRLYRSLVRDKKIAMQVGGFNGFPGSKYDQLFAFYGMPMRGHNNAEIAAAIRDEIEKLKTTPVTDDELKMFKTRARAGVIRSLDDNETLALTLAQTQARYGDWRYVFEELKAIDKVSAADIQRVANKIFTPTNRTVGETAPPAKPAVAKGGQQ